MLRWRASRQWKWESESCDENCRISQYYIFVGRNNSWDAVQFSDTCWVSIITTPQGHQSLTVTSCAMDLHSTQRYSNALLRLPPYNCDCASVPLCMAFSGSSAARGLLLEHL